jgi:hypothetical protein
MPRWGEYVVGDTYGALSADVFEELELAARLQYSGNFREVIVKALLSPTSSLKSG